MEVDEVSDGDPLLSEYPIEGFFTGSALPGTPDLVLAMAGEDPLHRISAAAPPVGMRVAKRGVFAGYPAG